MAERASWLVAKREIREATRATAYRVSVLLSALALVAIIVIANLGKGGSEPTDVVVAGPTDAARVDSFEALSRQAGLNVAVTTAPDDAAATAKVEDGTADVAVSSDGTVITTRKPVDLASDSDVATVVRVLRTTLTLDNGLQAAGLTPQQATAVREATPPTVSSLHPEDEDTIDTDKIAAATITNILLFIMVQTYGQWVLQGVTREKSSRVVEVLLAMITPRQLLRGKITGVGVVALIHAAVLIVVAFVTARAVGVDLTSGVSAGNLLLAAVWFLLGYALYCGAFAAAGSLVSRVEDSQSVAFPVMLPLLFGYIVSFTAAGGATTLLWVLAFFPPTAVVAMPTMYAIGAAELWMVVVSMLLTVAAIVVVANLASRIYERSVLHSGRKLSWKEALRRRAEIGEATDASTGPRPSPSPSGWAA
jgi:ABC-2 type transport system permease protein